MTQESFNATINNDFTGYQSFSIGAFSFSRDEYFAYINWPQGEDKMPIDYFLRALMRDVAWNFFYGTVNFDEVFGTTNLYGTVEMYAGTKNEHYVKAGLEYSEIFDSNVLMDVFKKMLADWTNDGFDPFAAPAETGTAWGVKNASNQTALGRIRVVSERMVNIPGDAQLRTDENGYPVNRMFQDVQQDQPVIEAESGFENELHAFNLFGYLSRSDVTWNPSVSSVVKESLFCPTSEEFILPVFHGNDRVEWFVQLSDEIIWEVNDKNTNHPRAKVTMRAGDVAAMPADIRHQGASPKRSMLLVWENASPQIPEMVQNGTAPVVPVTWD